jgi:Ca2+-binding EF-hand superfamily protein
MSHCRPYPSLVGRLILFAPLVAVLPSLACRQSSELIAESGELEESLELGAESGELEESLELGAESGELETPDLSSGSPLSAPSSPLSSPPLSHRLLVLLPGGPLLCDVRFFIDGHSQEQYVADLTAELLALADVNHDGVASWQEITTADALKYGQWGNARAESEEERRQIVYRCDVNRNGRVDAEEVASFLAPSGAASAWIDTARSSERDPSTGRSSLFEWLDADQDQQIDRQEMQRAASRLRMLDRDDDGRLVREDLPGQSGMPAGRIVNRQSTPRTAQSQVVKLQESSDWSRVLFLIEDRYAFGSPVQAADFPLRKTLFEAIDADGDGVWSLAEAPELLRRGADLALVVEFAGEWPMLRMEVLVEPRSSTPRVVQEYSQVRWSSDGGELVIEADEGARTRESQWQQLWPQWDTDGDGSLDTNEFVAAADFLALPLPAVDRDGDGRVQSSEGMEVLRHRARAQNARIQIDLRSEAVPLWRRLDVNGDGGLSERELDAAAARLSELASSSEALTMSSLPSALILRFHRGTPIVEGVPPADSARMAGEAESPSASVPTWFEQTDTNRDGEISPREFLGPSSLLKQLDRNADGMLQPDEAR